MTLILIFKIIINKNLSVNFSNFQLLNKKFINFLFKEQSEKYKIILFPFSWKKKI